VESSEIVEREAGLRRALTRGQTIMISLGGAIGTGLFLSSGIALGYAGPAILISYVLTGVVAMAVVFSLSELAVAHPAAGSFGTYAEIYLGDFAGFVVRFTYWFAQVVATGFEAVAAGIYMSFWLPAAPVWLWSLAFAAVVLAANLRTVHVFGRIEYWLAIIKVAAIVFFIVLGMARIFGLGAPATGLGNLYRLPGGFMPYGLAGVWMASILALLSYVGTEVVAVTSGEAADPQRTIPAALAGALVRLALFYILALFVVAALFPWTQTRGGVAVSESPFVKVLELSGVPAAAGLMNFVLISAALSSMNTDVYLCSRMLFSLARRGHAPKGFGRLTGSGTPATAVLVTGVCVLTAVTAARFTPRAYAYLQGVALFGAILVWASILVSHLKFRRVRGADGLPVRAPLFPVLQIVGLVMLAALLVTMGLSPDWRISWLVGIPWLALLTVAYLAARRLERRRPAPVTP